ncbi:MAG: hypothetical protein ABI700_12675 [Chloroflexota bacterium]
MSQDSQDPMFKPFKEAPPSRPPRTFRVGRYQLPRLVLGCLVILAAVILCSGVTVFAADRLCYGNLTQRLPIYPNATIKSREHNFLSEFGMGNTVVIMTSPDAPDVVRSWYAVHTGEYLRESLRNNTPFYRMAQGQVNVTYDPANDTGSQIILYGTCVQ